MKKLVTISLSIIIFIVSLIFIFNNNIDDKKDAFEVSQWEKEYSRKKERHEKNLPGNKQFRIKELDKYFRGIRTRFEESNSNYPVNYLQSELEKAKNRSNILKSGQEVNWINRGPGNVGGRTRSVVVDISDPTNQTWFAGSATGGAWRTTDGGQSWENISEDIPYHAISSIIQSTSSPAILYIGTGESFPGSMGTTGGGIYKSTDKGDSWTQLVSTVNEDFRYVNRLVIDPSDENIVLAATTAGIYKTIDGGNSWSEVYTSEFSVEDLKADPNNFNNLFAGINSIGILRSTDGGDTWQLLKNGIFGRNGRFEIAISNVNSDRVYASVENFSRGSDVYTSADRGENWRMIENNVGGVVDYLGGQGGYDNTIAVHPFYEDTVFVGGVDIWKIGITDTTTVGEGVITNFDTLNTSSFLSFVDFNGVLPGISTGDLEEGTNLVSEDFIDVEIRFGPGLSQKAHRFTVPDQSTSGVPAGDYTYQDYVEVPFQVWDVDNNVQLMCSFRDQEKDGDFNLYERIGEAYGQLGREYIFINSVPYNPSSPNPDIAQQGGRSYKLIYFLWPNLAEGGEWMPQNLPESKIIIDYGYPDLLKGQVTNVSDSYNSFSGRNTYNQAQGKGKKAIPGFHPDHHALVMVPIDANINKFWIVNGNDGGLGISKNNGREFTQIKSGYNTTQFYGVSKRPFRNQYIGGMQDNGTWQSESGTDASLESDYVFRVGGDGFETVWNSEDPDKILASVYNNDIHLSSDGGQTWQPASGGIDGDGPFITKLTMLPSNPNKVFAVGTEGLWYTRTFGLIGWRMNELPEGWIPAGSTLSSSHNIEYSIANDSILWAGAALTQEFGWKIFVSTDLGNNFYAVNFPDNEKDVFISNIATHPTEPNTAYLIYSLFNEGKILRTEDLGQTWEDITGFDNNLSDTSNNGFPDVGCLSLFVFPDDPDRIWAGTELGIVESLDNGLSWNLLQSNLPTVPIWEIFMQDNQIVVATYGRGIWTYQYAEAPTAINNNPVIPLVKVYPNPSNGIFKVQMPGSYENEPLQISIYDITGMLVEKVVKDAGNEFSMNLSHLKGAYFLKIKSENQNYSGKILIQN